MNEQEKKVFVECLQDAVKCATDITYETLSLLFESMAKAVIEKHLTLEQVLIAMSQGLKMFVSKKED